MSDLFVCDLCIKVKLREGDEARIAAFEEDAWDVFEWLLSDTAVSFDEDYQKRNSISGDPPVWIFAALFRVKSLESRSEVERLLGRICLNAMSDLRARFPGRERSDIKVGIDGTWSGNIKDIRVSSEFLDTEEEDSI
jgi:hypothetical protein